MTLAATAAAGRIAATRRVRVRLGAIALLLASGATFSCSRQDAGKGHATAESTARAAPGDLVVMETERATFAEATVLEVAREAVRVRMHPAADVREVGTDALYVVRAADTSVSGQALGICQMEPHVWLGCRITSRSADTLEVEDEQGQRRTLPIHHVLRPSAMTTLNLQQAFKKASEREEFLKDAERAGPPRRPENWKQRADEPVVVRLGGVYVSAVIRKPRQDLVLVEVAGEGGAPRAMALDDVVPEPPVGGELLEERFACLRPSGAQRAWQFVRIKRVDGQRVRVVDAWGRVHDVTPRDVLPLGNSS
ncbi:MAG: hypothetical protein MUF54_14510 [Polyangiaceae bacterium]|nr:hypothetical protein [Polyangiaceae bacterium]